MAGISTMLERVGLPAQVIGVPPLFDIVYAAGDISDYRGWQRSDAEMSRRFNRRFREGGILKGESKFYVSLAHDEADVRHTLEIAQSAVDAEVAETRVPAQ
jgi:glutamate-1-semialdehyde 2,1-aminomutase